MEPIKILHTADWHLGQTFHEYDRKKEHDIFLHWIRKQIEEQQIDLLLISGDLFDTQNPSAAVQKMYYAFLREITQENPNLQIIIIAGNHDSAARLEAPNPLLEEMNITVRGVVKRDHNGNIDLDSLLIPLKKGGVCLAVPYLRQGDYPAAASYSEGVQNMYRTLIAKAQEQGEKRIIAMGHLFATGSEMATSEHSERMIVGSLESLDPSTFSEGIDYFALGHLHRAQRVSGQDNIRYSGAPLPMTFAEINYKQGAVLVTLGEEKKIEHLSFTPPVSLLSIPEKAAPIKDILKAIAALPEGTADDFAPFLEIKILITEPEPSLRKQIEDALQGKAVRLARIKQFSSHAQQGETRILSYDELKEMNPFEMAIDIYAKNYGQEEMSEALQKLLREVIAEVQEKNKGK